MPEAVMSGLRELDQKLWPESVVQDYCRELEQAAWLRNAMSAAWREGKENWRKEYSAEFEEQQWERWWQQGRRVASVRIRPMFFLRNGSIDAQNLEGVTGGFSRDLVRDIWDQCPDPRQTEQAYEGFVGALSSHGLLTD
jgi:hypothetical protein